MRERRKFETTNFAKSARRHKTRAKAYVLSRFQSFSRPPCIPPFHPPSPPRTLTILLNHPSKTPTITFPLSSFYFLEKHDDLKASSCCLERYCSFERPLALKRTTAEFFLEITCRGDELKKRKKVCVCVCACICKRKEREGGREGGKQTMKSFEDLRIVDFALGTLRSASTCRAVNSNGTPRIKV